MKRLEMRTVVRGAVVVAVVVSVVAGGVVIVREVFTCRPASDQAEIIEQFKADPLVAAAPFDGRLVSETSSPDHCIESREGTFPPNIRLSRAYEVPAPHRFDQLTAYSLYQLHQRFDQPAAAGGWLIEGTTAERYLSSITYCKLISGRASSADVVSASSESVVADVSAAGLGSQCLWMLRMSPPSTP